MNAVRFLSAARLGAVSIAAAIALGVCSPAQACGGPVTRTDALSATLQQLEAVLKSPEKLREARAWDLRREGKSEEVESLDKATHDEARALLRQSRAFAVQAKKLEKARPNSDKAGAKITAATETAEKAFALLHVDGPIFPLGAPMRCGAQRS